MTDEDALDQRIAELDTKFHESLAVVKDLETRMQTTKSCAICASYKPVPRPLAQQLKLPNDPQPLKNSIVQS